MSQFPSKVWDGSTELPTTLNLQVDSGSQTAAYLLLLDGWVQCPVASGNVSFNIVWNGESIFTDPRPMNNATTGSTALSTNRVLTCTNGVYNEDTGMYTNNLELVFNWDRASASAADPTTPTVNDVCVAMLPVAA